MHQWAGKPIVKPEDHDLLEQEAAVNEFGPHSIPRDQAEELAYAQYKRKQHLEAAGHHLRNMRLAVSTGEKKDAMKHNAIYGMHIKALGLNPLAAPPHMIQEFASRPMKDNRWRFRQHPADILLSTGPMSKSEREALGYYRLYEILDVDLRKDTAGFAGFDTSIQTPEDSPVHSNVAPHASTRGASIKPMTEKVKGMGKQSEAGPQQFNKGSTVVYNSERGDSYIPEDWVGIVSAHHIIKVGDSGGNRAHKHFYEVRWRKPDGDVVNDFLSQEELMTYKGGK